jgi:uncharacterized membrane protein YjgN (DUF898 family)
VDRSELPAVAPAREWPIRFVGSGSEYFRIWIVNLLLTLVTLGLYYPFAKVRRLRYFHGATEVGGQPLAFHADPWKMLRGYLLVALMLAAYTGAGQFSPMAGAIAFLIVAPLWPALWHSSMRFRLANTGWRGLRFAYTGTLKQAYAVMAVPLVLAMLSVALTLLVGEPEAQPRLPEVPPAPPPAPPPENEAGGAGGWAILFALLPLALALLLAPIFLWLLKRQQHRHYALGPEHTVFAVGLARFYGLFMRTAGLGLAALLVFVGVGALIIDVLGDGARGSPLLTTLVVLLGYLLFFALVGGYFTARLQNLVWNGTASARLRFDSRLSARKLAELWLRNTLFTLLTLGLYFPFAQVASARLRLQAVSVHAEVDPDTLVDEAGVLREAAAGDAAGDLFGLDIGL